MFNLFSRLSNDRLWALVRTASSTIQKKKQKKKKPDSKILVKSAQFSIILGWLPGFTSVGEERANLSAIVYL